VLEDKYKEDTTINDLLSVIVRAVNSAMKRDVASGDSYDVVIIDTKGYRELNTNEKRGILGN
jgi:proteasome beta subunit